MPDSLLFEIHPVKLVFVRFPQEHEAVVKALVGLQPNRKCYRLVGEVLVERTVEEVLPAVRGNKEQIELVGGCQLVV